MQVNPVGSILTTQTITTSIQDKLSVYAAKLLKELNDGQSLKPNQKLKIVAHSEYLPLVYAIVETAYKDLGYIDEKKYKELRERYDEVGKMIYGLRNSINPSLTT